MDDADRVIIVDPALAKKQSKSSMIKWGAIVLAVLVLAAAGVWFFLGSDSEDAGELIGITLTEPEEDKKPHEPKPMGEVWVMEDIFINPSGGGGRRHFMVAVVLELSSKANIEEINKRKPLLRDNLITLFSSQQIEVLANIKYRQAFRSRVKKIMDYQLGEGVVTRVFFDKWVFQ